MKASINTTQLISETYYGLILGYIIEFFWWRKKNIPDDVFLSLALALFQSNQANFVKNLKCFIISLLKPFTNFPI